MKPGHTSSLNAEARGFQGGRYLSCDIVLLQWLYISVVPGDGCTLAAITHLLQQCRGFAAASFNSCSHIDRGHGPALATASLGTAQPPGARACNQDSLINRQHKNAGWSITLLKACSKDYLTTRMRSSCEAQKTIRRERLQSGAGASFGEGWGVSWVHHLSEVGFQPCPSSEQDTEQFWSLSDVRRAVWHRQSHASCHSCVLRTIALVFWGGLFVFMGTGLTLRDQKWRQS